MKKKLNKFFVLLVYSAMLSISVAQTRTYIFSCSIEGGHKNVDGTSLNHASIIALGSFTPGFIPSSGNRSSWASNWQTLAIAKYESGFGYFEGLGYLSANTGNFTSGNRIWVWIVNRKGEWCAYSRNTWQWPLIGSGGGPPPLPTYIDVLEATTAAIGQINTAHGEIILADCSSFNSYVVTYSQWVSQYLTPSLTNPLLDADGDGRNNLNEFVLGGDPSMNDYGIAPITITKSGATFELRCSFPRAWVGGITLRTQTSSDLLSWTTHSPPPSGVWFDQTISTSSPKSFARLRTELTP